MKKNTKPKSKKKILVVVGVAVAIYLVIVGVAWAYYQSQRPNYRDLEKAFNELNIPEDWQEVSSSKNSGTWGLFCWQIEGEACPYKITTYSRETATNYDDIKTRVAYIEQQLVNLGYDNASNVYQKCSREDFINNDYHCGVGGVKDGTRLVVSLFSNNEKNSLKGNYASISLSKE